MNWGYVWLVGYGVVCIILFCVVIFGMLVYSDWAYGGGWTRLDRKIHPKRTKREQLMRDLQE